MGARNTPEQQRGYNAALRERRKAAGLDRKEIWVHPQDWPEVKALVDAKTRGREGAQGGKAGGVPRSGSGEAACDIS